MAVIERLADAGLYKQVVVPVIVNYDRREAVIADAGYNHFNRRVFSCEDFYTHRDSDLVKIDILGFRQFVEIGEALRAVDRGGMRPANLAELAGLGLYRPELQLEYYIAGLGSSVKWGGCQSFPYLGSSGEDRFLKLCPMGHRFAVTGKWRLAAVKKKGA